MPLPLVLAGVAAIGSGVYAVSKPFLHRYLMTQRPAIEEWALKNALEAIGLPDLMDEKLTRESFTGAINNHFLSGSDIQLTNLFDAKATKKDIEAYTLKKAAKELGIELVHATVDGMKDALKDWICDQIKEQIGASSGDLIDGAKDLSRVLIIIKSVRKNLDANGQPVPPPPVADTPAAISNRERQAKYRASHTRHWENR